MPKQTGQQHFCRWPVLQLLTSIADLYADSLRRNTPARPTKPVPSIRKVEGSGTAPANWADRMVSAAVVGWKPSQNRYWLGLEQTETPLKHGVFTLVKP